MTMPTKHGGSSFHGWLLMTITAGETPQVWQLRMLGRGTLAGQNCESCGLGHEGLEPGDERCFYMTLRVSDPDSIDPGIVYCTICIKELREHINNFASVDSEYRSFLYKPRLINMAPKFDLAM